MSAKESAILIAARKWRAFSREKWAAKAALINSGRFAEWDHKRSGYYQTERRLLQDLSNAIDQAEREISE